jgi:hypothetical protein
MAGVRDFCAELAGHEHFIFHDRKASIVRQALVLGPISNASAVLEIRWGSLTARGGIGTRMLGLAAAGF